MCIWKEDTFYVLADTPFCAMAWPTLCSVQTVHPRLHHTKHPGADNTVNTVADFADDVIVALMGTIGDLTPQFDLKKL